MISSESPLPGPLLRLAVLGDFDGVHTRAWLSFFIERGHEVHAISYYRPQAELPGAHLHVLKDRPAPSLSVAQAGAGMQSRMLAAELRRAIPPSIARFMHARRYQQAGLARVVREICPDVFHGHYVVEHGFYGALAGFHPYIISAWGSDLLVAPSTLPGSIVARYALRRADLVTVNDPSMALRATALGVPPERVRTVRLGIDPLFFESPPSSLDLDAASSAAPILISDRALEPNYNVDVVLRAFATLRESLPAARLLFAGAGSERPRLEGIASELALGDSVTFLGLLSPADLRRALESAQVYVSAPTSDSFALSNLEAMATGCFPLLSDLPSVAGMIESGVTGLLVPPQDVGALAAAMRRALVDPELRNNAIAPNRAMAEAQGNRQRNLQALEREFYRLAGHPLAGDAAI